MSHAKNFGVQSFCFRNIKDNAEVAAKVKEIGLDRIEVCEVHTDFSQLNTAKEAFAIYQQAGVAIISIGVQTFTGKASQEVWFECAQAAGAKHISCHFQVDSFAEAVPMVRRWSQKYGIRVGIHCHGGYLFGGQPDVIDYLLKIGGPEIGLCIDTAWCMQLGPHFGNPVEWAKKYAGRIYGVHFKDFVFEKDARWQDVVVGQGTLDLPGFVKALDDGGFDGMAVIEYEADPDNPVPALKNCVEQMRSVF